MPATAENLKFAIELEADRLINSNVAREDLLSEMTVVRNEFEQGENSPSAILYQRLLATAYEWHNYGKPTIGNRTDIERVPIDRLKAFYAKYYQPDNAMLVVAGKFDEAAALKLIDEYFGSIPKPKRKLDVTYTEEPTQDGERSVILRRVGDVGLVGAVYHVPAGPHEDIEALDILGSVLGNEPSGRLYKALVEPHKAASVAVDVTSWHDPGVFELFAEVRKEDSLETAIETLLSTAENFTKTPVTAEEVDRARTKLLKLREQRAADTSALAVELSDWAAQGDWRLYFLYRDRLKKVTPDDVSRVAGKYLIRSNRSSGRFVPTDKPDRVTIPETPDLAKLLKNYEGQTEISAGEEFDTSPANIDARSERAKVGKGIMAVLLPKKTRGETVHLRLNLRYGNKDNLKKYRQACDFLPSMMARGTKKLTREQLQDQLDAQAATLSVGGEVGLAHFVIETKRDNLPAVLDLLRQVLREPSFPAEEFDVLKQESLAGLEEQLTEPKTLAANKLRRTVNPYAPDDVRFTSTPAEEIEETNALKLDDVKKLYRDFLGSQAGELAIVGDFDPAQALELTRKSLADWSAAQPYERIPKLVFSDVKGQQLKIVTPDKANAVYAAGEVFALSDADPDYASLVMGNFIFGGSSLSSRLGDRVRQSEGLSYGVASFFGAEALDRRASITLFAIFNPDNAKKVETAMDEELALLLKKGVTADELAKAKTAYLQEQEVGRSNDGHLVSILADTLYDGRTMQYYVDLEKRINAQTPESVHKALVKYIEPKRLVQVIAGDFSAKKVAVGAAEKEDAEE
jgi:zinc protease